MAVVPSLMCAVVLGGPAVSYSQSFELYGAAGVTVTDAGSSLAAGVGASVAPRLTLLANVERTHLSSRTRRDAGLVSYFRGGTYLLGSAELRVALRGPDRGGVRPFATAGFAAGVSRPNVNSVFPTPVTNGARAVFGGGGVSVPLGARVTAFADARMLIGAEESEGIVAVAPVRGGVGWRF
jgi:hypothetical protein